MDSKRTADLGALVAEVCADPFAVKNRLLPRHLRATWSAVGRFCASSILAKKASAGGPAQQRSAAAATRALDDEAPLPPSPAQGVALPGLGTINAGPTLQDKFAPYKRWRPAFALVEGGKFASVAQERPKHRLAGRRAGAAAARPGACTQLWLPIPSDPLCPAGKAPVVQLNYTAIAAEAGVHRSLAQHLVSDLCFRLATHLLSGSTIKVRRRSMVAPAAHSELIMGSLCDRRVARADCWPCAAAGGVAARGRAADGRQQPAGVCLAAGAAGPAGRHLQRACRRRRCCCALRTVRWTGWSRVF
jgi:hypothetical protein